MGINPIGPGSMYPFAPIPLDTTPTVAPLPPVLPVAQPSAPAALTKQRRVQRDDQHVKQAVTPSTIRVVSLLNADLLSMVIRQLPTVQKLDLQRCPLLRSDHVDSIAQLHDLEHLLLPPCYALGVSGFAPLATSRRLRTIELKGCQTLSADDLSELGQRYPGVRFIAG